MDLCSLKLVEMLKSVVVFGKAHVQAWFYSIEWQKHEYCCGYQLNMGSLLDLICADASVHSELH